jgi:hypothetical protein
MLYKTKVWTPAVCFTRQKCGHLLYAAQDKIQMKENLNSKSTMWGFNVSRMVNMRAAVISNVTSCSLVDRWEHLDKPE